MTAEVFSDDLDYAVAIAELPLSAHRSTVREGAIVVLGRGHSWAERVSEAVSAGARALVLRDPSGDDADLADILTHEAGGAPIVIDRPLLRSDLIDDARNSGMQTPALVQVECSASAADFARVARDAVGWARVLAGGSLAYRSSRSTARGFVLLLERPSDGDEPALPISLIATRRRGRSQWIRATAIGAERIEVTIDVARRWSTIERTTGAGCSALPTRWGSGERMNLRRAIDALESGSTPTDIDDLRHDSALIARVEGAVAAE